MKKRKPKERIYVCHTYYHVYVACLKELTLPRAMRGKADLVLSTMSNDFGSLKERAEKSGLFEAVFMFEEKEEHAFPQLARYHEDHGNLVFNLFSRMIFTKLYGKLQQPYVPVDFKKYQDIYVFCDSDPIGYYLNYKKIHYHAVEDGLDCICYYDTARYDNRGHFGLKAFLAAHNLIFIQNGYSKYCVDMEVNNTSILKYPCSKYIEQPREAMVRRLTQDDLESIVVTPYKISRSNGTKPDKHIDCIISVKSRKNFTARFNVRAPGEDDYSIRESREYRSGERVVETTADIEKELDIGGARYVFDGWYKELPGSVTDEPDPKEKVSQDEWEEGYEPTDKELENGVVNFYAHYVLADIDPDTGVETDFFGLPLVLCAGAAVLGCKNRKKEEDE